MDRAKANRALARRIFTLTANKLEKAVEDESRSDASAFLAKLSEHYDELTKIQNSIVGFWLDDGERDEDAFEQDISAADAYVERWFILRQKANDLVIGAAPSLHNSNQPTIKGADEYSNCSSKEYRRRLKLPSYELPKFNGEIKGWIGFWSQFKKIHTDEELDNDEKFNYLLYSMELGSNARELIESFPPCGENYHKAIGQLKERFAKDEFIIDYYVRELLQLVVSKSVTKLSTTSLYHQLMTQIMALESLGVTQDKYAAFLFPLVESALPDEILRAWNRSHHCAKRAEEEKEDKAESLLSKLLRFFKQESESEERIRLSRFNINDHSYPSTSCLTTSDKDNNQQVLQIDKKEKVCLWCEMSSHTSSECITAVNMTLEQRREIIKKKKACSICLNVGHYWKQCRKPLKCIVCTKRHYPLLCNNLSKSMSNDDCQSMRPQAVLGQTDSVGTVLLQTLKVNIAHGDKVITVRALLDSGAQRTFIKSDVPQKLNLQPTGQLSLSQTLFGGAVTKKRPYRMFNINVRSLDGSFDCKMNALEQEKICGYLPKLSKGSILSNLKEKGISITDCVDDKSEISLLIGSDVLGSLLTGRSVRVDDHLLAMETRLGWTVQGPAVGVYCSADSINSLHTACTYDIEDFWKLETLGVKDESEVKAQYEKDSEVQSFFKGTVQLDDEGRYQVRLPWKDTSTILQSNYELALKRLKSTTSRLAKLGIIDDYDGVFREWLHSGIIEEVQNEDRVSGHYISHHAVIKEASLTTKIRPVFDASALDKGGHSLNSCLEKGLNLIELIPHLLIQFRKHRIGVTSDIKKAFLMISLHPQDRDYLKFLWWRDLDGGQRILTTFRHRRVVFGVTTSPYLLSATILHHLEKYNTDTANKLRKCFYVDNCVVSVKNVEEMQRFIKEAKEIMMAGKFELRCWVTGPEITDEEVVDTSVLGLNWDPRRDDLRCKFPPQKEGNITKRLVLSIAQTIFDPLGFLCPATIIPKLIIQKCWIMNVDWDQTLPEDLERSVMEWMRQINSLYHCRIPRRLSHADVDESDNSLHIFCDASASAYACCIFLRSEYNGEVSVQLILAKARVAPTKSITIPRIELMAALIASRLANEARKSLDISCKEYFWTDSSIVLAWIRRNSGLNIFVHNRVKEILNKTNVEDWHHIPGEMNPADLPSRGCNPDVLLKSLWWEGPHWLKGKSSEWPQSDVNVDEKEVEKEIKKSCMIVQEVDKFSERLTYFGKYTKIVRTIGWCLRFVYNCRHKLGKLEGDLFAEEYDVAENRLLQLLQNENFGNDEEIRMKLKLEVFRDSEGGLLRVKTRLTLSGDTYNFTAPILLPGKGLIIERLVAYKHKENLHAGSQTLINKLREFYWIIGCRRLAKQTIRNCVVCKRFTAKACDTPTAPLPTDRLRCGTPFQVTGVDFAGPLFLRSGEKCWIALFTCATYRAVHLEPCISLSTEEFMMALRRFLARRGEVKTIYSDNGTNFRGASNLLNDLDWQNIAKLTSTKKISWRFIPPASPWWGGFWERMVRTVKEILRRVIGKASLQLNELMTVLCEVETIINARPLTYITDNSENLIPLTPATFLHVDRSSSSSEVLDVNLIDGKILSSRWRYLKKLCADLKQRFRSEYLAGLVEKTSGNRQHTTLKPGDVVLIGADNLKRVNWPLGIIKEVHTGADGHSRVARVVTSTGERIRPYQRLFPLELSSHLQPVPSDASPVPVQPLARSVSPIVSRFGRPVKVPDRFTL